MDSIKDQQLSLESWVEKYLPLRVHYLTTELVEKFIKQDKQEELKQISDLMAQELRRAVIEDVGHPRLKQKALDFLTTLRFGDKMLTDGRNPKLRSETVGIVSSTTNSGDPLKKFQADIKKEVEKA